jgi:mercuric ion transport protein
MAIAQKSAMSSKGLLSTLPVVGFAMLPKIVCAACWPAYTALLGSVGIEFFDYSPYVLPLTIVSLLIAIGSLGLLARRRGRIEPFLIGVAAAATVVVGKFALEFDPLLYTGIGTLVVTALVPWKSKAPACCSG